MELTSIRHHSFEPQALEDEFRQAGLPGDRRVASGLMIVAIIFLVATVPAALALNIDAGRMGWVWVARGLAIAVAAAALMLVRRANQPRAYDGIVTTSLAAWFVAVIAENTLGPTAWTWFVPWDVFLTVSVYAAIPLPLTRQVALGAFLSVGDLVVLSQFKTPDPTFDLLDVILAFTCANIVGVFVSRERQAFRRRNFMAMRQEVAVRKALEAALQEVRTLQGIIPICAHCKNIRTDAGEWQQVEAYVRSHTDAKFSHGICPNCMEKHYPGVPAE